MRALLAVLLLAVLLLTACGADAPERRRVAVGAVALDVDLALTDEEQRAGLRGREVPPGYGMAFPQDPARVVRLTMSGVDRPLVAVFVRDGRAVEVARMTPCAGSVDACPVYGPDEPADLVVEAAPESLPSARAGDPVVLG